MLFSLTGGVHSMAECWWPEEIHQLLIIQYSSGSHGGVITGGVIIMDYTLYTSVVGCIRIPHLPSHAFFFFSGGLSCSTECQWL